MSHQAFLNEHKKQLYKYGNPEKGIKKDYKGANKMIEALENDHKFPLIYQGKKEVIVTGKIDGIDWMGKLDCLSPDKTMFFDLKNC
ncbi:hypothetical protein IV37_GL000155 [Fructilactobacillus fructivorans]|nr:hypothetical protein IV37_GL000155 [Fructilactobacillus fructivorans]